MSSLRLVIANKRYSSWSLRPWLVMTHFAIPFVEEKILLDLADSKANILRVSPSGRVPCLVDGDVAIWETLAIVEYLAESFPDRAIWPTDRAARAVARAISNEMHAGFVALRSACPMNLRRSFPWRDWGGPAAAAEVARIEQLIADARARFGGSGPFLFGAFSAADAMYAPVALRLLGYSWPISAPTRAWAQVVTALPAFAAWKAGADAESEIIAADEVECVD